MMPITIITSDNFDAEVKNVDMPVLIDFWAAWCGPCRMLAPIIDELSEEVSNVKFAKINIDEQRALAMQYQVSSVPTLMLFQNGQAAKRLVGVQPKDAILDFIK